MIFFVIIFASFTKSTIFGEIQILGAFFPVILNQKRSKFYCDEQYKNMVIDWMFFVFCIISDGKR